MNILTFYIFAVFGHSYFTDVYRKECLATSVKLLEKICKGVKPASYTQNFPDIPIACMNLVASVSDYFQCNKEQVCKPKHVHLIEILLLSLFIHFIPQKIAGSSRRRAKPPNCNNLCDLSGHGHNERMDVSVLQTEFAHKGLFAFLPN